ncbi:hypothetical protein Dimus_036553 [Dionaea muscipula]
MIPSGRGVLSFSLLSLSTAVETCTLTKLNLACRASHDSSFHPMAYSSISKFTVEGTFDSITVKLEGKVETNIFHPSTVYFIQSRTTCLNTIHQLVLGEPKVLTINTMHRKRKSISYRSQGAEAATYNASSKTYNTSNNMWEFQHTPSRWSGVIHDAHLAEKTKKVRAAKDLGKKICELIRRGNKDSSDGAMR